MAKSQPGKPMAENARLPQPAIRPYARSRPVGQTGERDRVVDQSETRAPAEPSVGSDVSTPAVYVRGQKRKVSKDLFQSFIFLSLLLASEIIVPGRGHLVF